MNTLALFTVFHLNMAYSSIEEEMRPEVVRRCYWPLLRLAADFDVPVGVEAPGYTLETIAAIDPVWVETLKTLLRAGLIEFVG
ncbi:MAG: glycoside hydrolase family 57, partial [Planctomycetes bacterium]|nr:glycoside hydrolase family 57 [Planctomycetota bacterium]